MLVHVPEPRQLDTPFHSAAKMGSAQIIGVCSCLYLCVVLLCFNWALFQTYVIRMYMWHNEVVTATASIVSVNYNKYIILFTWICIYLYICVYCNFQHTHLCIRICLTKSVTDTSRRQIVALKLYLQIFLWSPVIPWPLCCNVVILQHPLRKLYNNGMNSRNHKELGMMSVLLSEPYTSD